MTGDGRTSVRASGGTFYDFPATLFYAGLTTGGAVQSADSVDERELRRSMGRLSRRRSVPDDHTDRMSRPIPPWPRYDHIMSLDYDTPNMQVTQWNLSVQKQIGARLAVSASYLGNAHHSSVEPATDQSFGLSGIGTVHAGWSQYTTCSTTANRDQRRRLRLAYPTRAPETYTVTCRGSTAAARPATTVCCFPFSAGARGITVSGNYTWSHCISDPWDQNINSGLTGTGWQDPNDRDVTAETARSRR